MANVEPGNDAVALRAFKKAEARAKASHDLHVGLIMRQQDVSKSQALFIAYREGIAGLDKRLGK